MAGLLRIGLPVRTALEAWHEQVDGPVTADLVRVGRRLRLGADAGHALDALRSSLAEDAQALEVILAVLARIGGDGAAMVEGLARAVDARASALSVARAAGSGARLSGRLIAALPLAFFPLTTLGRGPLFDPVGLFLIAVGAGLSAVGIMWIGRLLPRPPERDDPAASLADLVAAVMFSGVDLGACLDAISENASSTIGDRLLEARRLVRLGVTWPEALHRSEERALRDLGASLKRARSLGLPVGATLRAWARIRRSEIERGFETATRRAGVLMMIPLAVCVLPSFILLGVAPFLRGLSAA